MAIWLKEPFCPQCYRQTGIRYLLQRLPDQLAWHCHCGFEIGMDALWDLWAPKTVPQETRPKRPPSKNHPLVKLDEELRRLGGG